MPEGPEIKVSACILDVILKGKYKIKDLYNYVDSRTYNVKDLHITSIFSHGKKMIITTNEGKALVVSFGLTGFFVLQINSRALSSHPESLRYIFELKPLSSSVKLMKTDDPCETEYMEYDTCTMYLCYYDQLKYGTIELHDNIEFIKGYSPDILSYKLYDIKFPYEDVYKACKRSRTIDIAGFIIDQKNMSGIGNYIKCECLYRSGISPERLAKSVTLQELTSIIDNASQIMLESYLSLNSDGYYLPVLFPSDTSLMYHDNINLSSINQNVMSDTYLHEINRINQLLTQIIDTYNINPKSLHTYNTLQKGLYHKQIYKKKIDPLGNNIVISNTKDKRKTFWVPSVQK